MSRPGVRAARPGDLPRIAELELASLPAPWPAEELARLLAASNTLALVADLESDGPVGYALFLRADDEAELLRMGVEPGARRRGIGRALVATGIARLEAGGVRRVWLEVRPSNLAARTLYEGLGFRLAGRRRGYYGDGEDALIYGREGPAPA